MNYRLLSNLYVVMGKLMPVLMRLHLSSLPACVRHTNRNVLTIQQYSSNGAYTHIISYENAAPECTTGHIRLFTSHCLCKQKYFMFSSFTKIFLFYNGSESTVTYFHKKN